MDPATGGRELRDRIGIVLQSSGIEDELTVGEALELYATPYSSPAPAAEVLELVGLTEHAHRRVSKLSGGQQRRIDLALGIIGRPDVLFLDEPTTGFDPSARRRSWDLVAGLRSLGTTIVLTTHYMDEAQHLADRVAVIVGGRIVAGGTPAQLVAAAGDTVIAFRVPAGHDLADLGLADLHVDGEAATLRTPTPTPVLHRLTAWALDRGIELEDLRVARPSLEDVYLALAEGQEGS
jgi:ABC-2 type transport system ATP-binding protein